MPGSLVFIAPELYKGNPIRVILKPNVNKKGLIANIVSSAYDAQGSITAKRWVRDGLLRYVDKAKSREFLKSSGLQLPNILK